MKALLAALFTLSLHAQELTFLEKFATPATRTEALQALTPLTRDWFYYQALDQQFNKFPRGEKDTKMVKFSLARANFCCTLNAPNFSFQLCP